MTITDDAGDVTVRTKDDGTLEIIGDVPRTVLVSDVLFRQMIDEINACRTRESG